MLDLFSRAIGGSSNGQMWFGSKAINKLKVWGDFQNALILDCVYVLINKNLVGHVRSILCMLLSVGFIIKDMVVGA